MDKKTRNVVIGIVMVALVVGGIYYFGKGTTADSGLPVTMECADADLNPIDCLTGKKLSAFSIIELPIGNVVANNADKAFMIIVTDSMARGMAPFA